MKKVILSGLMKKAFLVGIVLLFGGAAFAQDAPKVEVTGNYSVHAL